MGRNRFVTLGEAYGGTVDLIEQPELPALVQAYEQRLKSHRLRDTLHLHPLHARWG